LTTIWRFSLVLLAALLAACSPEAPKFRSTDISGADYGKELALTGHDGKRRSLADFLGKVVVLSFGFTHCPDVCPTMLADIAAVMKQLGSDAARVQVLFVTVDPERDTPDILANYVTAFDSSFIGLSGDAAATQRTAKEFKIFYQKVAGKTPTSYTMDHTAGAYVFDKDGRVRLFIRHGSSVDDIVADLRQLL